MTTIVFGWKPGSGAGVHWQASITRDLLCMDVTVADVPGRSDRWFSATNCGPLVVSAIARHNGIPLAVAHATLTAPPGRPPTSANRPADPIADPHGLGALAVTVVTMAEHDAVAALAAMGAGKTVAMREAKTPWIDRMPRGETDDDAHLIVGINALDMAVHEHRRDGQPTISHFHVGGGDPHGYHQHDGVATQSVCPSCFRGPDGGGYPCHCPAACGARYCQHPTESAATSQAAGHG